jgi:hypothetical protein
MCDCLACGGYENTILEAPTEVGNITAAASLQDWLAFHQQSASLLEGFILHAMPLLLLSLPVTPLLPLLHVLPLLLPPLLPLMISPAACYAPCCCARGHCHQAA